MVQQLLYLIILINIRHEFDFSDCHFRDLTLVLQSLSLLRLQKDRKLFVSIVGQANRIITEFSGPQLSAVLNSYANFQVEYVFST